jgi:hypothetical protein
MIYDAATIAMLRAVHVELLVGKVELLVARPKTFCALV